MQLLDLLQEEDENGDKLILLLEMWYYINSSEETDCKDVRLNDCLDPPDNKENEPNPQSNHKQQYGIMYTNVRFLDCHEHY